MSAGNSVANEVSQLFRTRRVSEIRSIESSVRAEAEELSVNLRTLLGTRYSDLLLAVDAVELARLQASERVRDAVAAVGSKANLLREEFLLRARSATAPTVPDIERRRETSNIGTNLLHVVDSPEFLHACLESGRVYDATVRFLSAEQAHMHLKTKQVAQGFVSSRWMLVEGFRSQICALALEKLSQQNLSDEEYAGFLVSMIALTSANDVSVALDVFFRDRSAWVVQSLTPSRNDTQAYSSVSTCFAAAAKVVRSTILCYFTLFLSDTPRVISMLRDLGASSVEKHVKAGIDSLAVSRAVTWLGDVRSTVVREGATLLQEIESSKELARCFDAIQDIFRENDKSWKKACEMIDNHDVSHGTDLFKPVLANRAKDITAKLVETAVDGVIKDFEAHFLDDASPQDDGNTLHGDPAWYSMSQQIARLPLRKDLQSCMDLACQLHRKSHVAGLIVSFEQRLGAAMDDVGHITRGMLDIAESFRFAVRSEVPRLAQYLIDGADHIEKDLTDHDTEYADRSSAAFRPPETFPLKAFGALHARALAVASAGTALLSSNQVLEAFVFRLHKDDGHNSGEIEQCSSGRDEFCDVIQRSSSKAYSLWAKGACRSLQVQLQHELKHVFQLEACQGSNGADPNERTTDDIADKNVSAQRLDSTSTNNSSRLFCPVSPSPAALRFTMAACELTHQAGGLALPKLAIDSLVMEMRTVVQTVYRAILRSYIKQREEFKKSDNLDRFVVEGQAENVYLQFLFDVKFFTVLLDHDATGLKLVSRPSSDRHGNEDLEQRQEKSSDLRDLQAIFIDHVDPVNMSGVHRTLDDAVINSLARSEVLLGSIVRTSRHAEAGSRPISGAVPASANLIEMARSVPRFVYLPAPMPSTFNVRNGLLAGLEAKAAANLMREDVPGLPKKALKPRDTESSVADYANRLTQNVGRIGRFLGSFRGVG